MEHQVQFYQVKNYNVMQKYEMLSAIGEGAYGVVLKCLDKENNNYVAIKKFKDSEDEELTKKTTFRQVKILKMMNHPNIVEMKEAFRKKGIVYLVFQYMENNLLQVLQKSQQGLRINLIRTLMYQLLQGLAYMHNLNVIHRDIKPQNLLVNSHNVLKICDFGFARQLRKDQSQEQITDYVATRWYRPPELLVGGDYGKEIDIWAVACIMCQLIDGNPLFPGENELDQLFLIQRSLGQLTPQLHERFIKNQRFLGMKFPEIHNLDPLQKKYFGKLCQKGMSLVKSCLKMDPRERLTAQEALKHPFFDAERDKINSSLDRRADSNFRKQVQTSATNRKDSQVPILERSTKNGKIYNKQLKSNFNPISMVYQSFNNCKLTTYNGASKSVGKDNKKYIYPNQNVSLEKHHKKDMMMKTEAKGFYIDGQQKFYDYGEALGKKSSDAASQSTNQLPFLVIGQASNHVPNSSVNQTQQSNRKGAIKKKPQIVLQKNTFNIKQAANRR